MYTFCTKNSNKISQKKLEWNLPQNFGWISQQKLYIDWKKKLN